MDARLSGAGWSKGYISLLWISLWLLSLLFISLVRRLNVTEAFMVGNNFLELLHYWFDEICNPGALMSHITIMLPCLRVRKSWQISMQSFRAHE